MHFPLPTFVPGPVATVIALILFAYYVAAPPLLRSWRARQKRRLAPKGRTPYATGFRHAAWCLLAEVLAVMAFLGTARSVSPVDIGWAPVVLADPEPLGLLLVGAGGLAVFVLLVVTVARSNLKLLQHVRSGELPPQVSREELLELPRERRELGAMAGGYAVVVLSHLLVVYTVLFPVLAQATDSALFAVLALGLLGGWQYVGHGGGMIWMMAVLTTAGLLVYALLLPGSLLVPVLLWGGYWTVVLGTARALIGLPIPQNARPLHPVEVTMLDADGNPVERPGQGALDR
ncbi:hypothetical protein NE857_17735 [Nocardiopsis exhalans]|uniref:Uncharacterized protein n=1 Tax=Nocardiopsis exhalans TaxID=163604 RepID=A0ABY5D0K5_9ACTN|nr:hypothetical protein [Nocardiopsis exhalans]USY17196.1 hypothetical protein NE857_17735 [Nocardiopsis exhalans]